MMELLLSGNIISHQLSVADQTILISHEPFQANGSSRMELPRAHANLGAKTITETVRKTRGTIAVNTRRIHHLQEVFRRLVILREDAIRMMRTKLIDMICGLSYIIYKL